MAWKRIIDVPLDLNRPRVVRIPGGDEVRASLGPGDFPTHALVALIDPHGGGGQTRLRIDFVYLLANEERTCGQEQGGVKVRLGVQSGRVFGIEACVGNDLKRVQLHFDVSAMQELARKQHRTVTPRELAHYETMSDALLPYVKRQLAEVQAPL